VYVYVYSVLVTLYSVLLLAIEQGTYDPENSGAEKPVPKTSWPEPKPKMASTLATGSVLCNAIAYERPEPESSR
jgi:hypothetical protein